MNYTNHSRVNDLLKNRVLKNILAYLIEMHFYWVSLNVFIHKWDQLIDWLIDWFANRFFWLIDWLVAWLVDWFNYLLIPRVSMPVWLRSLWPESCRRQSTLTRRRSSSRRRRIFSTRSMLLSEPSKQDQLAWSTFKIDFRDQ